MKVTWNASALVGVKVAPAPAQLTVPGTGMAPCIKVNATASIVVQSIALLKAT